MAASEYGRHTTTQLLCDTVRSDFVSFRNMWHQSRESAYHSYTCHHYMGRHQTQLVCVRSKTRLETLDFSENISLRGTFIGPQKRTPQGSMNPSSSVASFALLFGFPTPKRELNSSSGKAGSGETVLGDCINFHPSLLPRHRGSLTQFWAIFDADEEAQWRKPHQELAAGQT